MKSCGLPPTFSDRICDRWCSHEILRILGISAMFHHRVVHPFSSKVNPSPSPESHDLQGSASSFAVARTSGSSPSSSWGHGGWAPEADIHWRSSHFYGWKHKTGWWFQPLWKTLVSWDDYSQYTPIYGKIKAMFQTKQKRKWNLFSSLGRSSCDVAKPRRDITDITSKGCVCVGQHGKPPSLTLAQILNFKYEYDQTLQSSPHAMGNPHCHGNFFLWALLCRSLAVQQTDHLMEKSIDDKNDTETKQAILWYIND